MQSTSSSDRNYFGRQNHGTQIGQVYGTFNQVYVSAEDADRLLPLNLNSPGTAQQTKPSSLIPFSRNPDFVHRGDLLNRIDKAFSNPTAHNRLALWGLGGVGKSELGIEYAHRVAERFSDAPIWIFWINACTRSRVLEGFRAIAEAVNLPGKDRSEDLPLLVHNWLSNKNNGKWFIILDSADDVKVFFDPNGSAQTQGSANEPLGRFFPQSHHGAILITTRFRDLARRIVDPVHGILEVSTMSDAESVELLEKKLGYLPERKVAADLVEELGCVPLAISQAAAYILARAPLVSPESYLAQLRAGERERSRLLADDLGDWRRDRSSNAVFATWSISFAYIQVERPSAAEVLYLMSFYDPYGIPKWFLTGTDHPSHDVNTDGIPRRNLRWNRISDILRFLRQLELIPRPKPFSTIDIDADISMLRDYALISVKEPGGVFSMHPLVQASTRFWLKHCRLYDKFEKVFVDTIATWFVWESDICEYEWVLQRALPHIQAAFSHNASIIWHRYR
ncbi:hypothetical protein VTJ04DRAFT_9601 [Mycothermus thermophilus]|uniref:uncharacterized protein n=1 Tax=Humicola insolens TaxID=85995 RepID=UPI003742A79C